MLIHTRCLNLLLLIPNSHHDLEQVVEMHHATRDLLRRTWPVLGKPLNPTHGIRAHCAVKNSHLDHGLGCGERNGDLLTAKNFLDT